MENNDTRYQHLNALLYINFQLGGPHTECVRFHRERTWADKGCSNNYRPICEGGVIGKDIEM